MAQWLSRARLHVPALAVFAVAATATLVVTWQLDRTVRAQDQERFLNSADRLHDAVIGRIDMYVAMLRAGAGLFDVAPEVTGAEFRDFVARLDLAARYPGIQGIGFTSRIAAADLPRVEAARRRAGDVEFRVWPDDPRDEYHAIVYLEPLDRRNLAAIGYDMFTEPVRREAMERARDTGEPAASGPVTLVQEIDEREVQAGFLIYMPVYAGGAVPASIAERRERLLGFVYSPFRAGDLFAGIFGRDQRPRAGFELFDARAPETILHRSSQREAPWFTTSRDIDAQGRLWTLGVFSLEGLEQSSNAALVPLIRYGGIIISLLLAALVALQTQARHRLEQQAGALTALYAQVQQLLERERQARAEAERLSRSKDEFLATLSHELRTPLNAIQGWAHMLGMRSLPQVKQARAVDVILRSTQMQARLIDDLLDMSRIISGRIRLERQECRIADVLDAAVSGVRPAAEAKGVTIEAAGDMSMPTVHGDVNRLQQVFGNLLSNAVTFTPAGGHIAVRHRRVDGHVQVEVADTGRGIDRDFLPYVFDRFRQGDGSITRRHGGLGLGLSIARSLVEMHGGTIGAASDGRDRGATFIVTLPVATPGAGEPAVARSPALAAVPLVADMLGGVSILVVDDDADARELMRDVLAGYGAEVVTATGAEEALAIVGRRTMPFDLLVSDIGMPGTDGYALIRELHRGAPDGRRLPGIAVTAYASAEDAARALAAGYRLHVPKPITPHEMVAACAIVTGRVVP